MSVLRGLIFDNLGLKLVALLMAVLVYLNVYTDRTAVMTVSFPLQITGIADTLSLSGPVPAALQAEIRGTGKQLIRLRLSEPVLKISLDGVGRGRFSRALGDGDLPLSGFERLEVEHVRGPRMLELQLDRKRVRHVPVAARVEGVPAPGASVLGPIGISPGRVSVTGPEAALGTLDSLRLSTVRIDGRRDTVRVQVGPEALPDWCSVDPATVTVTVPIRRPPR